MSVPIKKRRADRRCWFIDDEALEDHDKDNQEDSEEEEEEDNQESDEEEEEQDDVKDNNDIDLDFNNNNNDFEFNGVDVSSNQHIPPLFESSSESVNDKCDDDSQQTHDQQVFPSLYESSEDDDADDESLNTITATSSAPSRQEETAVSTESERMFDCPIITSFPRPSFSKDRIQEFNYNQENAPCHRDAVITYETMGDDEILL